jgi:hypothetical protein
MKQLSLVAVLVILLTSFQSCKQKTTEEEVTTYTGIDIENRLAKYIEVELTADLSHLSENEKQMLPLLFEVADLMQEMYWVETYGDKEELMGKISDEDTKKFVEINYGPWDRLDGNNSFIEEIGEKPLGANFYPADMTKEEFEALEDENKSSLYTLIRRNEEGELSVHPYHEVFAEKVQKAHDLLLQAADLAEDEGLQNYLRLRAEALLNDDYQASDFAWLAMKENSIDFVVGPIETYEDALYGAKAAHESFILIKDKEWSQKLEKFASLLPQLQEMLPVEQKYKNEVPGASGNQLNAYDVVYYAGDCNAGSKTIAINLPNDELVRDSVGSRKLQLKNAMKAKFEKILIPIADVLIDEDQKQHVSFDAFFANTMFHEVGHGLGLSYLSEDKETTVREALQDMYTSIEEGKADILGLYIVTKLHEMGELGEVDLMDYYVTFMSSIFRSIRFGVSSAHGKANMLRFYYFQEKEAFMRNPETGTYRVDFEKMKVAMEELANEILTIQGDGDYEKAAAWVEKDGKVKEELQKDLDRLSEANIPVDIVFKQGPEMLGL